MSRQVLFWLQILLLPLVLVSMKSTAAAKLDRKHPDYLRAVLISKVTPYIYWQSERFESDVDKINLCVVESGRESLDKLWPYISLLNQRKSGLRSFNVIDVSHFKETPDKLPNDCHIYYFAQVNEQNTHYLIKKAQQESILTLCDTIDELNQGVMIGFIEQRGKLKIYMNDKAVNSSELKVKSSLLRIARKI
jgi:hypothetical protein